MPQEHATPITGLSAAEVAERVERGQVNLNMELKTKSVRELVIENLCTLFNLINVVLAALVIAAGSWKNLSFLAIVVLNTGIGIVQALRSKRMVDKLTLLATKKARVVRDGEEVEIDLEEIVLDDIVKIGRGDQIPADAVVIKGSAQVNESLLTGESDLIRKDPGATLMSGSFLDSGLVYARVVHVGADNYVSRINNEAKYVKKVNSEIMRALNAIVRFASVIMVPLGLALFYASVRDSFEAWAAASGASSTGLVDWLLATEVSGAQVSVAVLSTVGALLGMIPQGLVLLTSSVLAIATIRLARRKVLAQQLYCIETLARVDVLCLDKTGTITSGRMEVEGTYPLAVAAGPGEALRGVPDTVPALDFALANIARASAEDANETAKALLAYYARPENAVPEAELVRAIPFSSAKKWSGASFTCGSFVMGAAQFVLAPDAYAEISAEVSRLASTCRVLVVAAVEGFDADGDMRGRATPLGLVTIRDEIRASAAETIGYFVEQGVTLNVISGDDPRTVSSIAQVVGIPDAGAYVDATTLDTPAKVDAAVDRYHVFGRVTPMQKRELVQALQRRGHTVAMTGDGVNDVLALKEADCSVAMAAGSDAARNVAEIVLVENDFAAMPAVVAEGRRSINNLQRSAALFLTKTLFSMGLAAICIAFPPYPFQPIQMTLINFFCIGYPGFVLGLEANRARVEGIFLTNVVKRALPAALGVLVGACLNMALCSFAELSTATLSTMCLVTTSAVGCCLIARISWPFTPLRIALFISIVVGLAVGILGFADFFSIARLSLGMAVELVVVSLLSCALFFALARAMDRLQPRRTHSASGFGRGVQVKMGRSGMRSVRSTRSALRRFWWRSRDRFNRYVTEHRHEDAAAADHAFRAEGSAPKLPVGAAAPHRSRVAEQADGAEGADGKREHMISSDASDHGGQEAGAASSRPRKTAKRTKSGFSSVTKSSHGIHVTMPARKKR